MYNNLDDQLKKLVENSLEGPGSAIFHYTSPKIAENIIQSRFLKMQSHHKQNKEDNRELEAGKKLILKYLDEFKCCSQLRDTFQSYLTNGVEVFTSSFSQEQSCRYAKKKYGEHYIEFKECFINKIDGRYYETFANVIYDQNKQALLIKEMFHMYKYSTEEKKETQLALWLSIIIPFFKEQRDHRDNESRISTAHIFKHGKLASQQAVTEIPFENKDIIYHG
jgi:hypothetical protein